MEKIELQKLITKYYFLELDDQIITKIITQKNFKTYEQVDLFIKKTFILILNNKPSEFINIKRETIISNFINKELSYTNNYIENINQLKKIYPFYNLLENKQEILELNDKLLTINPLFQKIIKNINDNYYKININDDYILLLIESYLKNDSKDIENDDIDEERYQLLLKAKKGDKAAYDQFIESNMKLVISIALHYQTYGDFDDIKQSGNVGLIKAYNKFEIDKNFKFSTFAFYWIRREIIYYLNTNRAVNFPINDYYLISKIKKVIDKLSSQNKPITDQKISKETGIPITQVRRLRKVQLQVDSLNSPAINEDEDTEIINLIKDQCSVEEEYIKKNNKEQILIILNKIKEDNLLNEKEMEVLLMHTGFINNRVYTFDELGKKYNITRQAVQQIYKRSLCKIKTSKYFKKLAQYLEDENLKSKIISPRKI